MLKLSQGTKNYNIKVAPVNVLKVTSPQECNQGIMSLFLPLPSAGAELRWLCAALGFPPQDLRLETFPCRQ